MVKPLEVAKEVLYKFPKPSSLSVIVSLEPEPGWTDGKETVKESLVIPWP